MKKIATLIITMLLLVIIIPLTASEAHAAGKSGDGWYIDSDNCLYLTGNITLGETQSVPWYNYEDDITKVVALEGSKINRLNNLFFGSKKLESVDLRKLDTSKVESMEGMFRSCNNLKEANLAGIDTSKVTDMSYMFAWCYNLKSVDMSGFDTSSLYDCNYMFFQAKRIEEIDLSSFTSEKLKIVYFMFGSCENLKYIDLRNMDLKNCDNLNDDVGIIQGDEKLEKIVISKKDIGRFWKYDRIKENTWVDIDNTTYHSNYESFNMPLSKAAVNQIDGYVNLELYQVTKTGLGWKVINNVILEITGNVNNNSTVAYNMTPWNSFAPDIKRIVTSSGAQADNCIKLFAGFNNLVSADLSNLNTSEATSMNSMFYGCEKLEDLNISELNTDKVTDMANMFEFCSSLEKININNFNTSKVESMQNMFAYCDKLVSVDMSECAILNQADTRYMFSGDKALGKISADAKILKTNTGSYLYYHDTWKNVPTGAIYKSASDIDALTDKVTIISVLNEVNGWWLDGTGCLHLTGYVKNASAGESLTEWKDIRQEIKSVYAHAGSSIDNGSYLFSGCKNLEKVDISKLDTSRVQKMNNMFTADSSLVIVNLSGLNTANVWSMDNMFYGCSSLIALDLSSFNTEKLEKMDAMISRCPNLVSLDMSSFTTKSIRNGVINLANGDVNLSNIKANKDTFPLLANQMITANERWLCQNTGDYYKTVEEISGIKTTLNLIVLGNKTPYFYLDKYYFELPTLEKRQIVASMGDSTDEILMWCSSDDNIVAVDDYGVVTAHRYGRVTIKAITKKGAVNECVLQTRFYDVAGSNNSGSTNYQYYFDPVYWAADNNITTGYNGVYFGPADNCERRALMTFLWRIKGSPEPKNNASEYFTDMGSYAATSAANKSVAWAYENGITKGYTAKDGTKYFDPKAPISRKDTLIMIYRIAGKPAVTGTLTFSDTTGYTKGTDTYNSILWASQNGITSGYKDGTFKPTNDCLREHIVTFLYRANNKKVF